MQSLSLSASYQLALDAAKIQGDDEDLLGLQAITNELLNIIEKDGANKARCNLEPAYHNRQHIADAVLSMGYFLGQSPGLGAYERQLLLLVMLVHDYGHRGIANKLPDLSHEDESLELLSATPIKYLPSESIFFVKECVMGTGPENVTKVSEEFISNPLNSFSFIRALVNDADIAASFVESLGLELSKLILLEKGVASPSEADINQALGEFKSHARITTPVAQKLLGL